MLLRSSLPIVDTDRAIAIYAGAVGARWHNVVEFTVSADSKFGKNFAHLVI